MKKEKGLVNLVVLALIFLAPVISTATEIGGGYGRQFKGNTDLEQYEIFVREPLSYKTMLGDHYAIASDLELGAAVVREIHNEDSGLARFSVMPQLSIRPFDRLQFFAGLGAGFMLGDTEFTKHNLGGPLFLSAKLGLRFLFAENWGLEYVYYHQSNADIYAYNASLNMQQLTIFYTF